MGMSRADRQQNAWQENQNALDREHQLQMLQKSNDLSLQSWMEQFVASNEEWLKRFGAENEQWSKQLKQTQEAEYDTWLKQQKYLSPEQQASRLRAAGINPAVLVNGGSGFGSATPLPSINGGSVSSPSVSSPSGVSLISGSPSGHSSGGAHSEFQNVTDAIESVASLASQGIDVYKTYKKLGTEVDLMLSERDKNRSINSYQQMANEVYRVFGKSRAAADLTHEIALGYLAFMQGDTEKSQSLLNGAMRKYYDKLGDKVGIENETLPMLLAEQLNLIKEQQKTERSEQSSNFASARFAVANATNQEYWNKIYSSPKVRTSVISQFMSKAQLLYDEHKINEQEFKNMQSIGEKLKVSASHADFDYYWEKGMQLFDKVIDGASSFGRFKIGKDYVDLRRDEHDFNVEHYNDVEEEVVNHGKDARGYKFDHSYKRKRSPYNP